MRRLVAVVVAALGVGAAAPALGAGNAHFVKSSASLSGADLVASFKEAGLAAGSVETVTLQAQESVAYECVNGGGKNPSASNKRIFATTGAVSGSFSADRNGNINGSLELAPASAASLGFSCPPGMKTTFVGVTYSGVQLVDSTSGAQTSLGGTFSFQNPSAP